MKLNTYNFDLKYFWKWHFLLYGNFLRLKNRPQLPGAGSTRAGHHHRSDMPTSPRAIYVLKSAKCNETCLTYPNWPMFLMFFQTFVFYNFSKPNSEPNRKCSKKTGNASRLKGATLTSKSKWTATNVLLLQVHPL